MTAQEMIEGLKKGVRYRTEFGEFRLTEDARGKETVEYRGYTYSWFSKPLDILLSEIGDRLIVEEPRPKVFWAENNWNPSYNRLDCEYRTIYATPDMVPLIEKAVRELGGLQ